MMEFNLSKKDWNMSMLPGDEEEHMYLQKDVKEFVRLLKDRFGGGETGGVDIEFIDKLAGEKLI